MTRDSTCSSTGFLMTMIVMLWLSISLGPANARVDTYRNKECRDIYSATLLWTLPGTPSHLYRIKYQSCVDFYIYEEGECAFNCSEQHCVAESTGGQLNRVFYRTYLPIVGYVANWPILAGSWTGQSCAEFMANRMDTYRNATLGTYQRWEKTIQSDIIDIKAGRFGRRILFEGLRRGSTTGR